MVLKRSTKWIRAIANSPTMATGRRSVSTGMRRPSWRASGASARPSLPIFPWPGDRELLPIPTNCPTIRPDPTFGVGFHIGRWLRGKLASPMDLTPTEEQQSLVEVLHDFAASE